MSNTRADEVTQPEEALILVVPMEVFIKNFVPVAPHGDIARLSQTCRQMYSFFKDKLAKEGAKKLLHAVIFCDWNTIKEITSCNPELMFPLINMTDFNGAELKNISPLAYALY